MDIQLSLPGADVVHIYESIDPFDESATRAAANAPTFSEVRVWLERIWDDVQNALREVTRHGEAKVAEWMARLDAKLAEARRELGERADALMTRLQELLVEGSRGLLTALLRLLPPAAQIQSGAVPLKELTVQYQMSVGGDVSAS